MSTHRSHGIPRNFTRRIPDEPLFTDGVRCFFLFACRSNLSHRVVIPFRSTETVPEGRCPSCGGEMILQSSFWEGDTPAAGYDSDAAFKAILEDGYYAWTSS